MIRSTPLSSLVAVLLLAGCVGQFDAPSAYETQTNYCDPSNAQAYADAVDACRAQFAADGGCAGVLSFKGTLEGRPVVVGSTLSSAHVTVLPQGAGVPPLVDEVEVLGASPYFTFNAKFRSLGGELAPLNGTPRTLDFTPSPNSLPDPLQDENVLTQLRLSGADSVGYVGAPGGTAVIEDQSPQDITGTFQGSFGSASDVISACFHIFPTQVDAESKPIQ